MSKIGTKIEENDNTKINRNAFSKMIDKMNQLSNVIDKGGGKVAYERQHSKGRLTVRERIDNLIDPDTVFLEIGKFAAHNMYKEYGSIPAAGVIAGLGKVSGQECMIVANDATVKAGAYFEITLKKTLRAQEIAWKNNLPIIFGILTTDNINQAYDRCGGRDSKHIATARETEKFLDDSDEKISVVGNVGFNTGLDAVRMANLFNLIANL